MWNKQTWYQGKGKAWNQAYYKTNRERIKAWKKVYRKVNKERLNAECKDYRQEHKKERKIYQQSYVKANSEIYREANRKSRALKNTTQTEAINEKIIYLRDGWVCQHCKIKVNKQLKWPDPMSASLDHIVPLSQGGSHTYNNVQLAHLRCNLTKNNNILPQGEQLRMF